MPADSTTPDDKRAEAILKLGRNRVLAHAVLFQHRHPQETPGFHEDIIRLWHSATPRALIEAFRGGAKSTLAEEAIVVLACYREFRNCIVLGESYDRACERLRAIKHEFESNELLIELFGPLAGETWQEGKIVLTNGVIIQAFGRGQSLRGSKHLDARPDMVFGDDMEDEESILTPEAREKFKQWFLKVVMPALAPGYRFRVAGTPLDPEAWVVKLKANPEWVSRSFPIKHRDPETGEWRATWPDRFPMEAIDAIEQGYVAAGGSQEFQQEYMCEALNPASKTFTKEMIRVKPTVRTWEAPYACFDPARTVKQRSALTGWAVWSWVGSRLVVWDAAGGLLRPDEIVSKVFEINDLYQPVHVGVEETGLNEFILQPLRQEQVRRQTMVPIRPLNAPKGKLDFIKGLQPFAKAGELIFAKPLPLLEQQMLAFPTGNIDTLNALAYALRMKPGQPVYPEFNHNHVMESAALVRSEPVWLAVNGNAKFTSGALVQSVRGGIIVTHDWVYEGDPGAALADVVRAASLAASRSLRVVAGPAHFGTHDTVGLRGAGRKIPVDIDRGGGELAGRDNLRQLLRSTREGEPAVRIAPGARWTLNAISSGYAYGVTKQGVLSDFAEPGPYRTLMEGLEAFAGLLGTGTMESDDSRHFAYTKTGRKYLSALAR